MTSPQIGRELAQARTQELRRAAELHRMRRVAATAAACEREGGAAVVAARPARWLVRLVGATLRH